MKTNLVTVKLDDLPEYNFTKKYTWWGFIGKIERIVKYPRTLKNKTKYFIQRGKRGYSDQDLWSADMYIAEVIAGVLESYGNHKWGVGYPYSKGGDVNKEYIAMQKDYIKHAKLFREYAKNGMAISEKWKAEFGGLTEKELANILRWFTKVYPGLWD